MIQNMLNRLSATGLSCNNNSFYNNNVNSILDEVFNYSDKSRGSFMSNIIGASELLTEDAINSTKRSRADEMG
jgi:hypothetical protein